MKNIASYPIFKKIKLRNMNRKQQDKILLIKSHDHISLLTLVLTLESILHIYESTIRPYIEYCCQILSGGSALVMTKTKPNINFRSFILLYIYCIKSTILARDRRESGVKLVVTILNLANLIRNLFIHQNLLNHHKISFITIHWTHTAILHILVGSGGLQKQPCYKKIS